MRIDPAPVILYDIKFMIARVIGFLTTDIWRIRLRDLPRGKSIPLKLVRIVVLAIRGFDEDNCLLRASSLTFYSLLSIVPVLAMSFGVAKGFGFDTLLRDQIMARLAGQEQVAEQALRFADSLLERTKGGVIAGVGVAVLFWTVIRVLSNIEASFNRIWGVTRSRPLMRRFSDYLSISLICPVLLILSSSLMIFIAGRAELLTERTVLLGPIVSFLVKLIPYCFSWLPFTFIYIFMPNTKVKFRSGLIAALVAGTIFQLLNWTFVRFQIGVVRYGAIYGSFAFLPLFLTWLQLSWLVVLFGAEVSFAHQNVDTYEFEPDCLAVSSSFKSLLALLVTHRIIKAFCNGEEPWTSARLSHELEIPVRLVRQILHDLVQARVVAERATEDASESAYQPARGVGTLTVRSVMEALEQNGTRDIPVARSEDMKKLNGLLGSFSDQLRESETNLLLKDL